MTYFLPCFRDNLTERDNRRSTLCRFRATLCRRPVIMRIKTVQLQSRRKIWLKCCSLLTGPSPTQTKPVRPSLHPATSKLIQAAGTGNRGVGGMEAATSLQHRHISSHLMVAAVEKEEVSRPLSLLAAPRATSSTTEATRLKQGLYATNFQLLFRF